MEDSVQWPAVLAGVAFRYVLMQFGIFSLAERPELATPINSFKRLKEGLILSQNGQDPYLGVLFHETPLALEFFSFMYSHFNDTVVNVMFVLVDLATAIILSKVADIVAARLITKQAQELASYHSDANPELLIKIELVQPMARNVQAAYLLHPFLIASCAARTTTVFANLLLAAFLWAATLNYNILACLCLALSTYQSFYPVMLLVPLILMNENKTKTTLRVIPVFGLILSTIYYLSYLAMGQRWTFLLSTLGFILTVPELTPNMGLFWYFFTEMFEHFRLFFVCTFQLNCFVYVYPLAARLKNQVRFHILTYFSTVLMHFQPFLLSLSLIALTAIFKSYPSYGDVGFYMALLPTVSYLFPYMKQNFIVANTFIATSILGPVLYQLWIYNGSANANFYFAITLVFSTAQIFLVTDLLFAHVKREFYLNCGFKAMKPTENGGPVILMQ